MSKRFEELLLRTETELLSRQLLAETPEYPRDELRIAQMEIAFVEQALGRPHRGRATKRSQRSAASPRRVVGLVVDRLVRR